ncbi:hypothetical protein LINPERHAP1_LOCUS41031 [Linum perenne]
MPAHLPYRRRGRDAYWRPTPRWTAAERRRCCVGRRRLWWREWPATLRAMTASMLAGLIGAPRVSRRTYFLSTISRPSFAPMNVMLTVLTSSIFTSI